MSHDATAVRSQATPEAGAAPHHDEKKMKRKKKRKHKKSHSSSSVEPPRPAPIDTGGASLSTSFEVPPVRERRASVLSDDQITNLRAVFDAIDVDGNGALEKEEVEVVLKLAGLGSAQVDAFVELLRKLAEEAAGVAADGHAEEKSSSSWKADFTSFLDAVTLASSRYGIDLGERAEEVQKEVTDLTMAFRACDADGSGEIDEGELADVLRRIGTEAPKSEAAELFGIVDLDNDGTITFHEFMNAVADGAISRDAGALNVQTLMELGSMFDADKRVTDTEAAYEINSMTKMERLGTHMLNRHHRGKQKRKEMQEAERQRRAAHAFDTHITGGSVTLYGQAFPFRIVVNTMDVPAGYGGIRPGEEVRIRSVLQIPRGADAIELERAYPLDAERENWGDVAVAGSDIDVGGGIVRRSENLDAAIGATPVHDVSSDDEALPPSPRHIAVKTPQATSSLALDVGEGRQRHVFTEFQRRQLNYTVTTAMIIAGLIGLTSGIIAGIAEDYAKATYETEGIEQDERGIEPLIYYWLVVGGVSVFASALEIALCFINALRSAMATSKVVGLELYPPDKERAFVAAALARAALEIPHPTQNSLNIDPLREARKRKCAFILVGLLYKGKTGLSSFLLKLFIKRVATRAAAKRFLPFVSAPVNAFWNMLVFRKVMRDAKMVVIGPSSVVAFLNHFVAGRSLSLLCRQQLLRCVGVAAVEKQAMHPNHSIMFSNLMRVLGDLKVDPKTKSEPEYDDEDRFFELLGACENDEELTLQIITLMFAIMIDGDLTKKNKRLYRKVVAIAGVPYNWEALKVLLDQIVNGRDVNYTLLHDLATREGTTWKPPQRRCAALTKCCKRFLDCITI